MGRTTTATVDYNVPIEIEWVCSQCQHQVKVKHIANIRGEASTRSPGTKALNNINEQAHENADDLLKYWLDNLKNAGTSREYFGTKLDCECPNCHNREFWAQKNTKTREVLIAILPFTIIVGLIGFFGWVSSALIKAFCCLLPLLIIIVVLKILDKNEKKTNNTLTQTLDEKSLPIVYYKDAIISCPSYLLKSITENKVITDDVLSIIKNNKKYETDAKIMSHTISESEIQKDVGLSMMCYKIRKPHRTKEKHSNSQQEISN